MELRNEGAGIKIMVGEGLLVQFELRVTYLIDCTVCFHLVLRGIK